MSLRRLLAWLIAPLAVGVALVALLLVGVWLVLPLPATREWVRAELESVLASALDAPLRIESVPALWPTGIRLDGVRIGEEPGMIRAASLSLELGLASLTPPRVAFDVDLVRPEVDLVPEDDGRWNVERLGGPAAPADDDESIDLPRWISRVGVRIDEGELTIRGLAPEPLRASALDVEGRLWIGILRDSVVEIDALDARLGDGSRVALHGTYELEGAERLNAALAVTPLVGRDLAGLVPDLRPEARIEGTVDVEGTFDSPRVRVDLSSGDARLAGAAAMTSEGSEDGVQVELKAASIDPAAFVEGAPAGRVTVAGDLAAGLTDDELRTIAGELTFTESRLFDVEVEQLSIRAATEEERVQVHLDGTTPESEMRTSLLATVALAEPHAVHVTGDFDLRDPVAASPELRTYLSGSELRGSLDLDVADPLADVPTATLDLKLQPGRLRGLPVDGADLQARVSPELVSLERLWIGADRTDLEGHGWLKLSGEDRDAVGGKLRGPISLALFTDAHGVVDTDVTFWGRATDLGLAAILNSSGPVEVPGFEGTFSSRLDVEHLGAATGGNAKLDLQGAFGPEEGAARILGRDDLPTNVRVTWERLSRGDAGDALVDRVDVDLSIGEGRPTGASLQALVQIQGDDVHVEVPGFEVRPVVGPPWRLEPPATIDVRADGVRVDRLELAVGSGTIEAHGQIAGGDRGKNDLEVRVADVDVGVLCDLLVVGDECAGRLGAQLDVSGGVRDPEVRFELGIDDLAASEQSYGALRARARTQAGKLEIAAEVRGGEAGELRLDGAIPLVTGERGPVVAMDRSARLELRASDFQIDVLRALAGRAVRRLDGRASASVDLSGPLADPRLSGRLEVADLTFGAAATGATHRDGRVRLSIDPNRFVLEELTLDSDAITAGGEIGLDGGLPRSFDLWLALDEAEVVTRSEADVTASGRVELTGAVAAPSLDGEVVIDRATIRPTIAPGGGAPEPDPSVVVVRRYDTAPEWESGVPPSLGGEDRALPMRPGQGGPRVNAGTPDLYDDLSMMVTVRLGDPVVVRRYDANIRLSGEVYLTKAPADELRITGGIGGRQGWYIFQGRRFEIRSAHVTFTGETPLDPYLDVEAQYRTGEYQIQVRITGTAKHPSLDLSSDPPLDQSDILAVILFGKPASQLNDSQGQVLQSQAFALLASYVAPELQRSVLDTFGLTSLTFSMPTGDTAGTIGVGRYFGDDVFVSVARDFGGPSGGTNRELQGLVGSSVTIQYFLTPSITLQGASSTEGESSADVIWHRRY